MRSDPECEKTLLDLIYNGGEDDPQYISIAEAIRLEEQVYADLQRRKEAARQAESDYWKWLSED